MPPLHPKDALPRSCLLQPKWTRDWWDLLVKSVSNRREEEGDDDVAATLKFHVKEEDVERYRTADIVSSCWCWLVVVLMGMKVGVAKLYSCTVVQSCQSDHFLLIKSEEAPSSFSLELPGGMDARWTLCPRGWPRWWWWWSTPMMVMMATTDDSQDQICRVFAVVDTLNPG